MNSPNNPKTAFEQFLENSANRSMFEQEKLFVEITELLANAMESQRVSRAELAKRLGKSKAFVTQVLRGRHNMTLRTLADLFNAMDCRVLVDAVQTSSMKSVKGGSSWTFDTEPCWRHAGTVWEHNAKPSVPASSLCEEPLAMGVAA